MWYILIVSVRPLFCLPLTFCSFYLGRPGGQLLRKSCTRRLPLVLFLLYAVLFVLFSLLMSEAGWGSRLYRFLIIDFSSKYFAYQRGAPKKYPVDSFNALIIPVLGDRIYNPFSYFLSLQHVFDTVLKLKT